MFDELPIYENVMDVSTITGYDSSIFIYSREGIKNINDIFHQCLGLYGVPKNKTLKATKSILPDLNIQFKKQNIYMFKI